MRVNYKSDFHFILDINSCVMGEDGTCQRTPLGWPEFDWEAVFWTANRTQCFRASRTGDKLLNCINDNGRIHVVVNSPRMGCGTLKVEFHAKVPDGIFADGICDTYEPQPLDIELVTGPGDCASLMVAELLLPMLKGDKGDKGDTGAQGPRGEKGEPFRFSDFTPEQIAELQRPATEAAEAATSVVAAIKEVEETISEQERLRRIAEEQRRQTMTEIDKTMQGVVTAEPADEGVTLKDKDGTTIYPVTSTKSVFDGAGVDVETRMQRMQDGVDLAKMQLFCDLMNRAVGKYGYARITDWQFDCELNGLRLNYDEALDVYNRYSVSLNLEQQYSNCAARTNIPVYFQWGTLEIPRLAEYNTRIEVVRLGGVVDAATFTACFYGCSALREVTISLRGKLTEVTPFTGCRSLQVLHLKGLNGSLSLKDSPLIERESFDYIIDNAANTDEITLTVHPDVYAKLTDPENEEWFAILENAINKNISFATT